MILRKIHKQLSYFLKMLLEDTKNNELFYNYLIIDNKNDLFNFDKLDEQFVKYGSNISESKCRPIISLAKKIIYVWNERATNDMIIKSKDPFVFIKEDDSFMLNTIIGFRLIRILDNRKILNEYKFPTKRTGRAGEQLERSIKKSLDKSKYLKNISLYDVANKCVQLIGQLTLEYPKDAFSNIEIIGFENDRFVFKNDDAEDNIIIKTEQIYRRRLVDIFIGSNDEVKINYDRIIGQLVEERFIELNNNKMKWKIPIRESEITSKKALCTLLFILQEKDYIIPNLSNVEMTKIVENTFSNITFTPKTYGLNKKNYSKSSHYSKAFHFIN